MLCCTALAVHNSGEYCNGSMCISERAMQFIVKYEMTLTTVLLSHAFNRKASFPILRALMLKVGIRLLDCLVSFKCMWSNVRCLRSRVLDNVLPNKIKGEL